MMLMDLQNQIIQTQQAIDNDRSFLLSKLESVSKQMFGKQTNDVRLSKYKKSVNHTINKYTFVTIDCKLILTIC